MENYKEKYEDALERARVWKEKSGMPVDKQGILDDIFSELKESEDEKIRKELIQYLKDYPNLPNGNYCRDDFFAWLEKQGELIEKYEDKLDRCACSNFDKGYKAALEKQGEQKPADKVEPKFKVGDWIINSEGMLRHILAVDKTGYQTDYGWLTQDIYDNTYHLWTIQDAKDGDVLISSNAKPFIYNGKFNKRFVGGYCGFDVDGLFIVGKHIEECNWTRNANIKPATKEQCDLLFQKIKEKGYEWDAEKKELKKIEQKTTKLPNGEDYGIDSLYHAARILEKTLGEVEGYQSDDGILEHKCAIEAVNRLYKQKPAWSKEDEQMFTLCASSVKTRYNDGLLSFNEYEQASLWLKSLKERMKGECISVTDEELAQAKKDAYNDALDKIEYHSGEPTFDDGWSAAIWYLKKKNTQPQNTWKPSDTQMQALEKVRVILHNPNIWDESNPILYQYEELMRDLIKLREE